MKKSLAGRVAKRDDALRDTHTNSCERFVHSPKAVEAPRSRKKKTKFISIIVFGVTNWNDLKYNNKQESIGIK